MSASETVLLINPRRRRRAKRKSSARRRRRNPVSMYTGFKRPGTVNANPRRRRRRNPNGNNASRRATRMGYRRNPTMFAGGAIGGLFNEALWGAAGALTVNALINHSPLPFQLKSGFGGFALRGLGAIVLNTFGRRIGLGANARKMALGSLTVTMTDLTRVTLAPMVPGVNLSGLGFYSPAMLATRPALPGNANQAGRMGNVTQLSGAKVGNGKLGMFVAGRGR